MDPSKVQSLCVSLPVTKHVMLAGIKIYIAYVTVHYVDNYAFLMINKKSNFMEMKLEHKIWPIFCVTYQLIEFLRKYMSAVYKEERGKYKRLSMVIN